jgi:hypothetical protein
MMRPWLLLLFLAAPISGCAEKVSFLMVNPDAIGTDQGTLISIGDIRTVAQVMVDSMSSSTTLASRRATRQPLRALVGPFKQRTSIAIFDKEIFINRLLGDLTEADREGLYTFILPVSSSEAPRATAELVLTGEVREILTLEPVPGGGERQKRTVQYTLTLTDIESAQLVWAHAHEIVKQQITGALYR